MSRCDIEFGWTSGGNGASFGWMAKRARYVRTLGKSEDLKSKLLAFIDYFNQVFAKPFKWTYTGRPLKV